MIYFILFEKISYLLFFYIDMNTNFTSLNFRLFEDKVYLAVLSKGMNIKRNKYAYEDGSNAGEDIERKISNKVLLLIL
jgi:hypothetical protein